MRDVREGHYLPENKPKWKHLQSQQNLQEKVGKVERKRTQGRPSKMWLDNIKDWTRLSIEHLLDSTQEPMAMSMKLIVN